LKSALQNTLEDLILKKKPITKRAGGVVTQGVGPDNTQSKEQCWRYHDT
jgi:hypothetical protein